MSCQPEKNTDSDKPREITQKEEKALKKLADIEEREESRERAKKQIYSTDGIACITNKMRINALQDGRIIGYNVYLITGWFEGRLDYVEIYLSGMHEHNIRAETEVLTRMARDLLRSGNWTVDDLVGCLRGYEFEPHGPCDQLKEIEGENYRPPKSILDAVARVILARKDAWLDMYPQMRQLALDIS